jgi:hypothetical protein
MAKKRRPTPAPPAGNPLRGLQSGFVSWKNPSRGDESFAREGVALFELRRPFRAQSLPTAPELTQNFIDNPAGPKRTMPFSAVMRPTQAHRVPMLELFLPVRNPLGTSAIVRNKGLKSSLFVLLIPQAKLAGQRLPLCHNSREQLQQPEHQT